MTALRLALCGLLFLAPMISAAEPPSYGQQIRPFFAKYCLECHSGKAAEGGLDLSNHKTLLGGGDHGPVLTPGQAEKSRIVRMLEGKTKPAMPPKKAKQPTLAEVALIRAWVDGGARDDGKTVVVILPEILPRLATHAPLSALAYRPDGKLLAVGSHTRVQLVDPQTGDLRGSLPGQTDRVTALAFSPDGQVLAVASGKVGASGEVRLYRAALDKLPGEQPGMILAHQDLIYGLAFSPDGKLLATCGYDRLIHLWDAATGKRVKDLRDHSDAVYAVAFSPDGKLLASGSADRAVKIWDVANGVRLHTLSESTDWVYTLAWNPLGGQLAGAGVDKSIRVWEVSAQGGKIVRSVFAHEAPVTRVIYSADGKTLYSLGEDRVVKAWDAARMVERLVYSRQAETVLSLAVRSDQKQVALGRFDGVLSLLEEATGKVQGEPLPIKPKPPVLDKITPSSGVQGRTLPLWLEGANLDGAEVVTTIPDAKAGVVANREAQLAIPRQTAVGVYQISVKNAAGQSVTRPFTVDRFPLVEEVEPRASARTARTIPLPATIVGKIDRAGAVDFYRFEARAGEEIGIQALTGTVGSKLEPILQLADGEGRVLLESSNGLLGYTCVRAGTYAVGIRDHDYRGDQTMHYRLYIGDVPIVTGIYPRGMQRGTKADVALDGVNLGTSRKVHVKVPADAGPGTRFPVAFKAPGGTPLGTLDVVVGEFPEVIDPVQDRTLPVPGTANGRLMHAGASDVWKFQGRKGQRLILDVEARRAGSPLDSSIEILDSEGKLIPVATLRSVAMTYVTFRDHDSASTGIRLENWNDLAVNDYVFVGGELIRIRELPRGPDDDCQFFSARGQRIGFLGTTPTYHSLGQPMYKVMIHPPGTTFPPNGLPVVTLYARNDDGGPGHGKDSRLVFDPPTDGVYQVRIRDTRGQGSPQHVYRLTVRTPQPGFNVSFSPTAPAVSKGSGLPIGVVAERLDEFDGEIHLKLENLPPGLSAPETSILPGEITTSFTLFAEPGATLPAKPAPLKLAARAKIGGQDVIREVVGNVPVLNEPGDIAAITEQSEVTIKPGAETRVNVRIERRNGFTGRVPIDVRGLPHGVRVLDVGLNGILVTEKDTTRTFVLYAEPWVKPTQHPFVVFARREGKNTEHAARSVLLKVLEK
jgi:WD40 repeat protein